MVVLFGLLTAASFGIGDFLAGLVARRTGALTVVIHSQIVGAVGTTGAALLLAGAPVLADALWGAAAGVMLGLGFIIYYRALVAGRMGIVATITAVWTAIVPLAVGLAMGERPSVVAIAGIALVIVAIALVAHGGGKSDSPDSGRQRRSLFQGGFLTLRHGVAEATLAGVGFGLFIVFLDRAEADNPLWPAAWAMIASVVVVIGLVPVLRPVLRVPWRAMGIIALVGLAQALGTLTLLLGVREGLLSIVAVAAALSPVPTACCALLFLGERLSRQQLVGFCMALTGVVLMISG